MDSQIPKNYISSIEASRDFKKTNDYISFLCRKGFISGVLVERQWYVDPASLAAYLELQEQWRSGWHKKLSQQLSQEYRQNTQVAGVFGVFLNPARDVARFLRGVLLGSPERAAVTVLSVVMATFIFWSVAPYLGLSQRARGGVSGGEVVANVLSGLPTPVNVATSTLTAESVSAANTAGVSSQNIVKVIETVRTVTEPASISEMPQIPELAALSNAYTDTQIQILKNSLSSEIFKFSSTQYPSAPGISQATANLAISSRIDRLSNVSISNGTLSGGTLSGGSISNTSVSASDLAVSGGTTFSGGVTANTLTVTGNITVSGTQSLSGALTIPYLSATSSTASSFAGGLTAFASTTIGDSTQIGGLTVNGGATTTGNAAFLGTVRISDSNTPNTGTLYFGTTSGANINHNSSDYMFNVGSIYTAAGRIVAQANSETLGLGVRYASGGGTYFLGATTGLTPDLIFTNNGNLERARLTDSGNFGIGTTSPWGLLSVNANGLASSSPQFVVGSSTKTDFIVANGGNVGIGTTTPWRAFSVNGSSDLGINALAGSFTATSTVASSFVGGLTSFASTTIGAGGQTTGLTISGGATTTGNAYFAGNVGIGTTMASSTLHVNASSGLGLLITDSDGTPTSNAGVINFKSSLPTGADQRLGFYQFGVVSAGLNKITASMEAKAETAWTDAVSYPTYMAFSTTPSGATSRSERLRVTSSGSIGIGTTTPWGLLSVNASAIGAAPQFVVGSSTKTSFVVDTAGNVGIGSSTPSAGLAVATDAATRFTVESTAGSDTRDFEIDSSGNITFAYYYKPGNGYLLKAVKSTKIVEIGGEATLQFMGGSASSIYAKDSAGYALISNGWDGLHNYKKFGYGSNTIVFNNTGAGDNIGVGTTTPFAKFSIHANPSDTNTALFAVASSTASATTTLFTIKNSGNIGVGTSSPASTFSVQGDSYVSGTSYFGGAIVATSTLSVGTSTLTNLVVTNTSTSTFAGALGAGNSTFAVYKDGTTWVGGGINSAYGYQMQVGGNGLFTKSLIIAGSSGVTPVSFIDRGSVGSLVFTTLYGGNIGVGGSQNSPALVAGSDNAVIVGDSSAGYGTINSNTLEVIRNVGAVAKLGLYNTGTTNNSQLTFGNNILGGGGSATEYFSIGNDVTNSNSLVIANGGTLATNPRVALTTGGNFGVGTTSPFAKFSVHANNGETNALLFAIASSTASATTTLFSVLNTGNVGIGTTTPLSTLTVSGSACFSQGAGTGSVLCGSAAGNIYYKTANTGNYDVAENYVTQDAQVVPGTIVAVSSPIATGVGSSPSIALATSSSSLFGVVSSAPGVLLGGADASAASSTGTYIRAVALVGRVPVKVNLEGGDIAVGDAITLSSVAGIGTKATTTIQTIGVALEPYSAGTATSSVGMIEVFIKPEYTFSQGDRSRLAEIVAGSATTSAETLADTSVFASASATLRSGIRNLGMSAVQLFTSALYATTGIFEKVFAKEVHTDRVCVSDDSGETCISKSQLDTLLASAAASQSGGGQGTTTPDTLAPEITILGSNPATISVGDSYIDPGVTITDNVDQNLGYTASIDGGPEVAGENITLDTSVEATHTITYKALDQSGNVATSTRTVIVSQPSI